MVTIVNNNVLYYLKVAKKVDLQSSHHGDIKYRMVTIVNNNVLYYLKVAKKVDLQSSHHEEKNCNLCGDGC